VHENETIKRVTTAKRANYIKTKMLGSFPQHRQLTRMRYGRVYMYQWFNLTGRGSWEMTYTSQRSTLHARTGADGREAGQRRHRTLLNTAAVHW
jgi:hypothetical protein